MQVKKLETGVSKLVHHPEHLAKMRAGQVVAPIHVSIWPTVRCQLNCSYCCCRNEDEYERSAEAVGGEERHTEMTLQEVKTAVDALALYGTKAIEFSGGGEPTLWPHLADAVDYIHDKGISLSLITNGLSLDLLSNDTIKKFSWIRISIQSMNYVQKIKWQRLVDLTRISFSYIVADGESYDEIRKFHPYCAVEGITTRIAIQRPSTDEREKEAEEVVNELGWPFFFSHKEEGQPKACYMAWVRAAIDWRGTFLVCPASQLTKSSEGKIEQSFGLCHVTELKDWLENNPPKDLGYRCKFCNCGKEHNDFVDDLIKGVEDVEFC